MQGIGKAMFLRDAKSDHTQPIILDRFSKNRGNGVKYEFPGAKPGIPASGRAEREENGIPDHDDIGPRKK